MDKIDQCICPNCGDDDTGLDDDWMYDYGYTIRICDGPNGCNKKYKVYWEKVAIRAEVLVDK